MQKATPSNTTTTPTTADRASFTDVTCELNVGVKLLISHLDNAFDAGFELDMKVGADVMDAIIAAQWVARRLSEDIHTLGFEFDQDTSNPSIVKSKQAAE
jgi:hypothetical protein